MLSRFITPGIPTVMTKQQNKRQRYIVFKYNEIIQYSDLDRFDVPDGIKAMMKEWDLINKSPYSNSFYSTEEIDWSVKPEGSYRVSDHWNFTSQRDDQKRKHCRTDKSVPCTTHLTIARYENGVYRVLLTEPLNSFVKKNEEMNAKKAYLRDPLVIAKKREFKERVTNGEIFITYIKNEKEVKGRVLKYTGYELRIVDVATSEVIFSDNNFSIGKGKLEMYDSNGVEVKNLF